MPRTAILALDLLLAFSPQARTNQAVTCASYFSSEASLRQDIAALFADLRADHMLPSGESALTICARDGKPFNYQLQFPAVADFGVCHFYEFDIAKAFSATGKYRGAAALHALAADKSNIAPGAYPNAPAKKAMIAPGACPRQSDSGYVSMHGVSYGLFREIMAVWQQITASPDVLAASVMRERFVVNPPLAAGEIPVWQEFQNAMAGRAANMPPVYVVMFDEGAEVYDLPASSTSVFTLYLGDPGTRLLWTVGIELTLDGWKIVKIGQILT